MTRDELVLIVVNSFKRLPDNTAIEDVAGPLVDAFLKHLEAEAEKPDSPMVKAAHAKWKVAHETGNGDDFDKISAALVAAIQAIRRSEG